VNDTQPPAEHFVVSSEQLVDVLRKLQGAGRIIIGVRFGPDPFNTVMVRDPEE
jgi:hypothetical protein